MRFCLKISDLCLTLLCTFIVETTLHHSRITHGKAVVRNVVHDDGSGTNNATLADGHAGQDGDAAAKPSVVANGDGIRCLHGLTPIEIVHGVLGCKQLTVRTNEHMVADGDDGSTEKRTIVVDEHMLTDVVATGMVTIKRRTDHRRVGYTRCHTLKQRPKVR